MGVIRLGVLDGLDIDAPVSHDRARAANRAGSHQVAPLELAAQAAERLLLDLADAFTRQRVALADLLEGLLGAVTEAQALAQDLRLHRRQRIEGLLELA